MTTVETPPDLLVSRFDQLAARAKEIFEASADRSPEALEAALAEAREGFEAAGELSRDDGEKLKGWLRRDLQLARRCAHLVQASPRGGLDHDPVSAGYLALAAAVLDSRSEALTAWAAEVDEATKFHTGEITGPGTLSCGLCGTATHLLASSRIPPCAKCQAAVFTKSFGVGHG